MSIWLPIIVVTIIGLICGVGLSLASHVMAVKEDERFPSVRGCLPGANCGACGFSGCDDYAHAILEKGADINKCVPGGADSAKRLGEVLGKDSGAIREMAALVQCRGDCEAAQKKHVYEGIRECKAAKLFFGGSGTCVYGCLGLGDCAEVCPEHAITINKGIAHIDTKSCKGCGLCAAACPQKIIAVIPRDSRTGVLCSNKEKGAFARKECKNACIGCGKCARSCPQEAISVIDNLAVIDRSKCTGCGSCIEGCPTGAISKLSL